MAKYQCPECKATLRRAEAIAPGKKIRCPKCEAVFKAVLIEEEAPEDEAGGYAVAGVTAPAPKPDEEEYDSNPYSVIQESGEEGKQQIQLGSLRDKFAKSKIGPAMFQTVLPSNYLLRLGLFSCVVATATFIYGVWPIIFCEANPLRPFIRPRVDIMYQASLMFAFGSIMCLGAARMQDLTSYTWSIIGSCMAIVIYVPSGIIIASVILLMFGPLGMLLIALDLGLAFVGVWCLIVLFNAKVREGFKERAEAID
ncbi:MAG: hypothetical protein EXS09_05190 [Gemmataceae bacterium]|nr:hypothetical protein [Gemmataceae bacterium]